MHRLSGWSQSVAVGLLLLLVSGCTIGTIDKNAAIGSKDERYFVLGFGVAGYDRDKSLITIWGGEIDGGKFRSTEEFAHRPVFVGSPQEGFIIGKARAGAMLGLIGVTTQLLGTGFLACGNSLVFKVKGGTVEYITNATFATTEDWRHARPEYKQDFDSARSFMHSHYPQMADKIEPGEYRIVPMDTSTLPNLQDCDR